MKYKFINVILKTITLLTIVLFITSGNAKALQIKLENKELEGKLRYSGIDFSQLENIYGKQDGTFETIGSKILGIVSFLCYATAIIVLVYKGVQFMNKAPEAKAELKKELINVAIGAFILVAAGAIVQIISNIAIGPLFS